MSSYKEHATGHNPEGGLGLSYNQELWRMGWCWKASRLGPLLCVFGISIVYPIPWAPKTTCGGSQAPSPPCTGLPASGGTDHFISLYTNDPMVYRRIHRAQALRLRPPGLRFPPCRLLAMGQSGPFTQLSLCPLMCKMREVKNPPANAKDTRSILGPERFHMPRGN